MRRQSSDANADLKRPQKLVASAERARQSLAESPVALPDQSRARAANGDQTELQQMQARFDARTLAVADADDANPHAGPTLERLRPLQQVIERSEGALNRLSRLISDLLDVSHIQSGKLAMRYERVDLAHIVGEATDDERQIWPGRDIRLEPGDTSHPIWVIADPDRISQVVTNYLSNACKYAPPGLPITAPIERSGESARVSAHDLGPGLTLDQQIHLFERFYRVEGISHQQGSAVGLGLGLSICREIIERHGGDYGVRSALGEGSTFWFSLPVASYVESSTSAFD